MHKKTESIKTLFFAFSVRSAQKITDVEGVGTVDRVFFHRFVCAVNFGVILNNAINSKTETDGVRGEDFYTVALAELVAFLYYVHAVAQIGFYDTNKNVAGGICSGIVMVLLDLAKVKSVCIGTVAYGLKLPLKHIGIAGLVNGVAVCIGNCGNVIGRFHSAFDLE